MTQPRFSPQISVGNIIQIVVLVIAIAGGWFKMEHQNETQGIALTEIRQDVNGIEVRVRTVEQEQVRSDERYTSILNMFGSIDTRLERIEGLR